MNSIVLRLWSRTLSSAPPYLAGTGDQRHRFRRATARSIVPHDLCQAIAAGGTQADFLG
jgi:hypothetical protein